MLGIVSSSVESGGSISSEWRSSEDDEVDKRVCGWFERKTASYDRNSVGDRVERDETRGEEMRWNEVD